MRTMLRSSSPALPTLAVVALLGALEGWAGAAQLTVTSVGDLRDAAPGDGICSTTNGPCTLRAAVMEANALPGADTITIPQGMVISLARLGADEDAAENGDLDIDGTLTIDSAGATIWGTGDDRIFHVLEGASASISGVSLHGGTGVLYGGAIHNVGELVLSDCVISDNDASQGGGIANGLSDSDSSLVVQGCEIHDNMADYGGGIASGHGELEIADSTISFNIADELGGGVQIVGEHLASISSTDVQMNMAMIGGGITTRSPLELTEVLLEGNLATYGGGLHAHKSEAVVDARRTDFLYNEASLGGGIFNNGGDVSLRQASVSGNFAGGFGGGIYNMGHLEAQRGAVLGNGALSGAGIHNSFPGDLVLHNMTISGNTGGGLLVDLASVADLNNVTITANMGTPGGLSTSGTTHMINTILGGNYDLNGAPSDCIGTLTSHGHNLIEDTAACTIGGPATNDIHATAPGLEPLADNGGRTPTHAVLAGSAARNAGDDTTCRPVDQRSEPRPLGGTCDIGAYERN